MKIFNKTAFVIATAAILTAGTGCKKVLEEQPRSGLFPEYFGTAGGVQAAVTGVYNDLRGRFGNEGIIYFFNGTDEYISGGSSSNTGVIYNNYNGLNSSNSPDLMGMYVNINTINGVIQYASSITDATARTQYVAQAKFLRGWMYLLLVQTYGGTTATQKSGIPLHTTFITAATTADAPAPLTDIYNLIIQDFTDAAKDLSPKVTPAFSAGGVGKTATSAVANAYLAKTYLTRGYTEAKQADDFQKAADITATLITNRGTYGLDLWQDFNDAHKAANDYGKENMFAIDYGSTDPQYSGNVQSGSGGFGINLLMVLERFNYFTGTGIDNVPGIDAVPQRLSVKTGMLRDVYNGRPYVRVAPNAPYIMQQSFADQMHDCRYDATFQTYWICNSDVAAGTKSDGTLKGKLVKASNVSLTAYQTPMDGDTAILMPSEDVTMARRDAFKGLIVTPKQFNNNIFPNVKKFEDPARTTILDFGTRPLVFMRFSEIYLMNAEANYMAGNINAAATSLNVIRQRAAYRTPADALTVQKGHFAVTAASMAADNAANAAAMALTSAQLAQLAIPNNTTSTGAQCGMDLILDEYSREFHGDPRRWYDLVRTNQLVRRVKMYNTSGAPNIKDFHTRRPIPQTLIDAVLSGPKYPQNNGY